MALIVYNRENSRPQEVTYKGKRTINLDSRGTVYLDDTFHIPGLVISLVADLCICQRTVVTQGLQGSRADLQQQAHLLVVQPFLLFHVTVQPAEGVQSVRERPEGREHRLEGPCLNVHYFHNQCNFRFDICFILFSDPDSVPQFSESRRNILNFKTG